MREAAPGIDQLRRAVQLASARHRGEAGDQSIGIPASLAAGVLHLALKEFRERHPAVRITLREGTTQESLERLAAGRLDIAFVEGEPTLLGHAVEVLWTESIILALPANHDLASRKELTWRELGKETFVVRE